MSNTKVFNFKEQLEAGNSGERMFLLYYGPRTPVKSVADLAFDFTIDGDKKLELKTDTYSMTKTNNFFMERFGSVKTMKSGGPWRAKEDKLDFFVYCFEKEKTFFWFEPESLCKILDEFIKKSSYVEIRNSGWTTRGYKVPRELCIPAAILIDTF